MATIAPFFLYDPCFFAKTGHYPLRLRKSPAVPVSPSRPSQCFPLSRPLSPLSNPRRFCYIYLTRLGVALLPRGWFSFRSAFPFVVPRFHHVKCDVASPAGRLSSPLILDFFTSLPFFPCFRLFFLPKSPPLIGLGRLPTMSFPPVQGPLTIPFFFQLSVCVRKIVPRLLTILAIFHLKGQSARGFFQILE